MLCAAPFGSLRRKHHCRECGRVVCDKCSAKRRPAQAFIFTGSGDTIAPSPASKLRVCDMCHAPDLQHPRARMQRQAALEKMTRARHTTSRARLRAAAAAFCLFCVV